MTMRFPHLVFALVALLAAGWVSAAPQQADEPQQPTAFSSSVSMDQAVKIAEQRFQARVVRAEAEKDGDHTIYVLRMLNESGRVWTVRVDASNGAVL
jgi:uncharacterized membrane protein YkoI